MLRTVRVTGHVPDVFKRVNRWRFPVSISGDITYEVLWFGAAGRASGFVDGLFKVEVEQQVPWPRHHHTEPAQLSMIRLL